MGYRYSSTNDVIRNEMHSHFERQRRQLSTILEKVEEMAKAIEDLQAEVTENTTVVEGAISLINGLSEKLKEAAASGDMSQVEAIVAELDANNKRLADAVAANTLVPAPNPSQPVVEPEQPAPTDPVTPPA